MIHLQCIRTTVANECSKSLCLPMFDYHDSSKRKERGSFETPSLFEARRQVRASSLWLLNYIGLQPHERSCNFFLLFFRHFEFSQRIDQMLDCDIPIFFCDA